VAPGLDDRPSAGSAYVVTEADGDDVVPALLGEDEAGDSVRVGWPELACFERM